MAPWPNSTLNHFFVAQLSLEPEKTFIAITPVRAVSAPSRHGVDRLLEHCSIRTVEVVVGEINVGQELSADKVKR